MKRDVATTNRVFYEGLWRRAYLQRPDKFNTWPVVSNLAASAPLRLEVGPGMRPRLPIAGTHFVDISAPVVERLNAKGGIASIGEIGALTFPDEMFDLVCAFDVIEHVEDDRRVFRDLTRVLKDNGVLICAVPLHPERWTEFDDVVGHARRYVPSELVALLAENQLHVEQSALYGMQPSNPRLVSRGMWYLEHQPRRAMFFYNWVGMPLAMLFQKKLQWQRGMLDSTNVDEVVLVCRRGKR